MRLRLGRSLARGEVLGLAALQVLGGEGHALVLRVGRRRLAEGEDSLRAVLVGVVTHIRVGRGGRRERLNRPRFILDELILRNRNVAHQSTLGRLDLVEHALVADLDWEHFGPGVAREGVLLPVHQLRLQGFASIDLRGKRNNEIPKC